MRAVSPLWWRGLPQRPHLQSPGTGTPAMQRWGCHSHCPSPHGPEADRAGAVGLEGTGDGGPARRISVEDVHELAFLGGPPRGRPAPWESTGQVLPPAFPGGTPVRPKAGQCSRDGCPPLPHGSKSRTVRRPPSAPTARTSLLLPLSLTASRLRRTDCVSVRFTSLIPSRQLLLLVAVVACGPGPPPRSRSAAARSAPPAGGATISCAPGAVNSPMTDAMIAPDRFRGRSRRVRSACIWLAMVAGGALTGWYVVSKSKSG